MKKIFFVILTSCLLLAACERDDICAEGTPTTPLLVIEFFDIDNPAEEKIPENLFIVEQGADVGLEFNTARIAIPLRTDVDETRYNFILNTESEDTSLPQNIDTIVFSHLREEEFVSKACGFRVSYQALQDEFNPLDDGNWIDNITILNTTIEDETEAHIRIFH